MDEAYKLSFCRICLKIGATLPIFRSSTIYLKMCLVFGETIEDQDDYPKNICKPCNESLQEACDLIEKYKRSCKVLQDTLLTVVKEERLEDFGNFDVDFTTAKQEIKRLEVADSKDLLDYSYVQLDHCYTTFDPIKIENEDSIDVLGIQAIQIESVDEQNTSPEVRHENGTEKMEIEANSKADNKTNRNKLPRELECSDRQIDAKMKLNKLITASVLEGEFKWCGQEWRSNIPSTLNKIKETQIHEQKDRIIKTQTETLQKVATKPLGNITLKRLEGKPKVEQRLMLRSEVLQIEAQNKMCKLRRRDNTPVICDHCGVEFSAKKGLQQHMKLVNAERNIKCTYCPKMFKTQDYMNKHAIRIHKLNESDCIVCDICGKLFAHVGDLNQHRRYVHGTKRKKKVKSQLKPNVKCHICGKAFWSKGLMTVHIRAAHTGERPEECTICGKRFFSKKYLQEHLRIHTGDRPYKCPICPQRFTINANMKSHVKHNHKLSDVDEELLKTLKPSIVKRLKI